MPYSLDTRLQFNVCKTMLDSRPGFPVGRYSKTLGDYCGIFFQKETEHGCKSSFFQVKKSFGGSLLVCQSAKKERTFSIEIHQGYRKNYMLRFMQLV